MKTNDVPRTRRHAIPSNFMAANGGDGSAEVTTVDISSLIAMIDCEPSERGGAWAVVSKPASGCNYTTTAMRVRAGGERAFFRAGHGTGLVSFWKGVAQRRAAVEFVKGYADYQLEGEGSGKEGIELPEGHYLTRSTDSVIRFVPNAGPLPFNV